MTERKPWSFHLDAPNANETPTVMIDSSKNTMIHFKDQWAATWYKSSTNQDIVILRYLTISQTMPFQFSTIWSQLSARTWTLLSGSYSSWSSKKENSKPKSPCGWRCFGAFRDGRWAERKLKKMVFETRLLFWCFFSDWLKKHQLLVSSISSRQIRCFDEPKPLLFVLRGF